MNFEKWMKKRGNNKLNAYAKNPYRVSWIKRLPLWSKIVVPSALAMTAAVVIISVGVLPNFLARGKNASMSRGPKYSSANYSEVSNQDPKSVPQGSHSSQMNTSGGEGYLSRIFPSITYDNIEYTLTNNSGSSVVPVNHIDELLFNGKMKTVTETNIDVEIYSIKNIDKEVAVAFKTKYISNNYYAYINLATHFHDIDDFLNLLNPNTEMEITNLTYVNYTGVDFDKATKVEHKGYKEADIYNIIFSDKTIEGYTSEDYDYESSTEYYSMDLKFEALGIDSYNAYFFSSGYIVFDIFEGKHIFELGQAKYQELETYLTQYKIS